MKSARVALTPTTGRAGPARRCSISTSRTSRSTRSTARSPAAASPASLTFRRGDDGLTATSRIALGGGRMQPNSCRRPARRLPASSRSISTLEGSRPQPDRADRLARGQRHFHAAGWHASPVSIRRAFDAIIRDVDQGPADRCRCGSRDRMELALGNGGLNVPLAEGEIAVAAGQARLNNAMVRAERADARARRQPRSRRRARSMRKLTLIGSGQGRAAPAGPSGNRHRVEGPDRQRPRARSMSRRSRAGSRCARSSSSPSASMRLESKRDSTVARGADRRRAVAAPIAGHRWLRHAVPAGRCRASSAGSGACAEYPTPPPGTRAHSDRASAAIGRTPATARRSRGQSTSVRN